MSKPLIVRFDTRFHLVVTFSVLALGLTFTALLGTGVAEAKFPVEVIQATVAVAFVAAICVAKIVHTLVDDFLVLDPEASSIVRNRSIGPWSRSVPVATLTGARGVTIARSADPIGKSFDWYLALEIDGIAPIELSERCAHVSSSEPPTHLSARGIELAERLKLPLRKWCT